MPEEICCGAPLLYAGALDSAKDFALRLKYKIQEQNAKRLIVACPYGYVFFKNWYKKLDVKLNIEVVYYAEVIYSILSNISKKNISKDKLNNKLILINPYELKNNPDSLEDIDKIIKEFTNTKNINSVNKNNSYYFCGGILNVNDKTNTKEFLNEINNISNELKYDYIVTSSPICYHYIHEFGNSRARLAELSGYLLKLFN